MAVGFLLPSGGMGVTSREYMLMVKEREVVHVVEAIVVDELGRSRATKTSESQHPLVLPSLDKFMVRVGLLDSSESSKVGRSHDIRRHSLHEDPLGRFLHHFICNILSRPYRGSLLLNFVFHFGYLLNLNLRGDLSFSTCHSGKSLLASSFFSLGLFRSASDDLVSNDREH